MRADFSLARRVGHLIMGDGSGPDGLAEKDGAKALSGAESGDTPTTQLDKPSRTKNLIIELSALTEKPSPGRLFTTSVALNVSDRVSIWGICGTRDSWVSVRYAEGLHSTKSSVTLQRTD